MTGKLSVLSVLLVPFLGIGTYAGEHCGNIYCYTGCCENDQVCCAPDAGGGLSTGALVGIIIAVVVIMILFIAYSCWAMRRRRSAIIVHRVIVQDQQTTGTMIPPALNINPSHVGYDQAGTMGSNLPRPPSYYQATAMTPS